MLDISNNLFHHNQGGSVRLQNQAQANIYHNTFATADPIALELNYTSSATFSNNIVTHCVFESIYKDGTSTISGTNNLFYLEQQQSIPAHQPADPRPAVHRRGSWRTTSSSAAPRR